MIVFLDTNQDLKVCADELGVPTGQLLTPLTRYLPQYPAERFAIDNGAFSSFHRQGFESLLRREEDRKALCAFVAVPDVVGSARRTLECFAHWHVQPCLRGWPLALVAQDGQEDLPIPWPDIAAVFLGGSTAWKLSDGAAQIIRAAQVLGKWVHAGRVNTPGRFEYFRDLGVDSIDGTGLSRYTWMRTDIAAALDAPHLFPKEDFLCHPHG